MNELFRITAKIMHQTYPTKLIDFQVLEKINEIF